MVKSTTPTIPPRPFLKWAGGKSQLIPQYQPFFPKKFKNYYEPFLGGGAVFFYLIQTYPRFDAVLSDINDKLVETYRCVKHDVENLIQELDKHQLHHSYEYYYKVRGLEYETAWERAARIIYLNRTCFNGLYRENSKGQFNVPMGRYKKPTICNPELLRSVSQALSTAAIEVRSFDAVLSHGKSAEDFVYFDPPYQPVSDTSNFTSYSYHDFNKDDQVRLRDTFTELASRGVKVMLSNSDCELIRELYQEFRIVQVSANRAINSKSSKRGKIPEVLVMSYERE